MGWIQNTQVDCHSTLAYLVCYFNMSFPEDFGSWREEFSLPVPGLLKSPKCIPSPVYNVFPFQDSDSGTVG